MKTLFTISLLLITALNSFSQTKSKNMNTIVLVHGPWVDASCWDKIVPALKAAGHEVLVVSLPGHGADNTPFGNISLQSYVDAVKRTIGKRTVKWRNKSRIRSGTWVTSVHSCCAMARPGFNWEIPTKKVCFQNISGLMKKTDRQVLKKMVYKKYSQQMPPKPSLTI